MMIKAGLKPSPTVFGDLDPVVVSIERYAADTRTDKLNLGVGMYYDETGRVPLLEVVRIAEQRHFQNLAPRRYLPVEGTAEFRRSVERLLFGRKSTETNGPNIVSVQTLGGTGALRLGGEILRNLYPNSKIALSNPSWSNHPFIFQDAGFECVSYPYFNFLSRDLDIDGMFEEIRRLPRNTVVVLHGCCHNPTGVDLSPSDWGALVEILNERQLIPFIDLAYQGFGAGLDADSAPIRLIANAGLPVFVALSFSKSFALYGERIGALSISVPREADVQQLFHQAKNIIRGMYSTPPTHGAELVTTILETPELYQLWSRELDAMRSRIVEIRQALYARMLTGNPSSDPKYIVRQQGLFSFLDLSAEQVRRLREEYGIHILDDGRLCVAAVNFGNLDRIASAILKITDGSTIRGVYNA